MKVKYQSPWSIWVDMMVPEEAVSTYVMRDAALLALKAYGGIKAPDIREVRALRRVVQSSKRKIERNNWYSTRVQPKKEEGTQHDFMVRNLYSLKGDAA